MVIKVLGWISFKQCIISLLKFEHLPTPEIPTPNLVTLKILTLKSLRPLQIGGLGSWALGGDCELGFWGLGVVPFKIKICSEFENDISGAARSKNYLYKILLCYEQRSKKNNKEKCLVFIIIRGLSRKKKV